MSRGGAGTAWGAGLVLLGRALVVLVPAAGAFVLVTALLSSQIEEEAWLWALGGLGCVGPALLLRWRIGALLEGRPRQPPSVASLVALTNVAVAGVLALGFADDSGRALRRHGDWFVGERNGAVVRSFRGGVARVAGYLERFDPPSELRPPEPVPAAPLRPGDQPPAPRPLEAWFHPLSGPTRQMPLSASRRFGAARQQPKPPECELGHCGVDLGGIIGEPVYAVHDGVVESIVRDAEVGGKAGRYLKLSHQDGKVVTRYIHLDSIRNDLKVGDLVKGGETVAYLGRSGILRAGPHLHFAMSIRDAGRPGTKEKYFDSEPLLRTWQLVDLPPRTAVSSLLPKQVN